MRKLFLLLLFVLAACSSDDNVPPPDDDVSLPTDDMPAPSEHLTLSLQWEEEIAPFLPQGLAYGEPNQEYFYVAAKSGGLYVYEDVESGAITQIKNIPIAELANLHAMNVVRQDQYLYVALGDFFGDNSKAGLAVIDISNPSDPIVTDVWESTDVIGGSAIVKVQGDFAYLGAMKEGIFIFDISDPTAIQEIVQYTPDINFPLEEPGDVAHPNARGMDIAGDLLYLCYDAGGIRVIDVSDKLQPQEIGRYLNDTAQETTPKAYNNIMVTGSYGYIAVDYCGLEIIDLSNPSEISRIGWWNPWECDSLANLWLNSPGHSNQMAYDPQNELIFLATGKSELSILDVSDVNNPSLKSSFGTPENTLATWGMTLQGQDIYLLYIAAAVPLYSDWSGLKKLRWALE